MSLDLIGLTNQSFAEAGGKEVFPDLEMDAPVFAEVDGASKDRIFGLINSQLRTAANNQGDTYVFGIKYDINDLKYRVGQERVFAGKAVGTGYKPKK